MVLCEILCVREQTGKVCVCVCVCMGVAEDGPV